jgi:hypothetical protein
VPASDPQLHTSKVRAPELQIGDGTTQADNGPPVTMPATVRP